MKLSCEIVQDLLPLYQDEVCSPQSREAVEQHLRECDYCTALLSCREIPKPIAISPKKEEQAVRKSFRKIKHRWWLSILAVAMILPVIGLSIMIRNEYRGEGICFSNLKELWTCYGYLDALEAQDSVKAASYIDFSPLYLEYREAIEMKPEDYLAEMEEIQLNGEPWMVHEGFLDGLGEDLTEEELWRSILDSGREDAMIPIEVFHELVWDRGDLPLSYGGYRMDNGICYFPYETQLGTFMLHEGAWDRMNEKDGYLSDHVSMMPKPLYDQLEPLLWERAQQWCQDTRERLWQIIDLDEAAFKEYMENLYSKQLDDLFGKGFRFRENHYRSIYKFTGWDADFTVYAELQGQEERLEISFFCNNEGINHLYANDTGTGQVFHNQLDLLTPRIPYNTVS
ncbi:MAG: zf-HC2 domain-containing protein [Oscillospiraceae bacterium]|nr:zf-HC2 domain-containing protein [Oscillospiraceae bacterium]